MLPNIFLRSVCRHVLSRVTQMCPDASNVIMNGAGWAGLGWGWSVVAGGGWLTSEAAVCWCRCRRVQWLVSRHTAPRSLMPDAGPLAAPPPRQHRSPPSPCPPAECAPPPPLRPRPKWWHTSLAAKSRPAPAPSTDSSTPSVISSVLCLLHLFTPLLQVSPTPPRVEWMKHPSGSPPPPGSPRHQHNNNNNTELWSNVHCAR